MNSGPELVFSPRERQNLCLLKLMLALEVTVGVSYFLERKARELTRNLVVVDRKPYPDPYFAPYVSSGRPYRFCCGASACRLSLRPSASLCLCCVLRPFSSAASVVAFVGHLRSHHHCLSLLLSIFNVLPLSIVWPLLLHYFLLITGSIYSKFKLNSRSTTSRGSAAGAVGAITTATGEAAACGRKTPE